MSLLHSTSDCCLNSGNKRKGYTATKWWNSMLKTSVCTCCRPPHYSFNELHLELQNPGLRSYLEDYIKHSLSRILWRTSIIKLENLDCSHLLLWSYILLSVAMFTHSILFTNLSKNLWLCISGYQSGGSSKYCYLRCLCLSFGYLIFSVICVDPRKNESSWWKLMGILILKIIIMNK